MMFWPKGSFPIPTQGTDLPIVAERRPTDPAPEPVNGAIVSLYELLACIVDDEPPLLPPVPDLFSSEFADFITKCMVKEAKDRPDQATMLSHPWLSGDHPEVDLAAWVVSVVGPSAP